MWLFLALPFTRGELDDNYNRECALHSFTLYFCTARSHRGYDHGTNVLGSFLANEIMESQNEARQGTANVVYGTRKRDCGGRSTKREAIAI
jgi:hypothetical protein